MKIKDIGEIGLIKRIAGKIRYDRSVVKGIGDDAAVIRWSKNKYLLLTCDMLVEDVHFRLKDASPYRIGWKALGRNISDIAAMGGKSRHALVSIGIDPKLSVEFADGVSKGIAGLARKFNINIVGGDTVRSKRLVIDVCLLGEVEPDELTLRSTARPGDMIFVTGTLGGSIKGRHLNFMPRQDEARRLVKSYKISSMIDISDGLILDLWRIIDASKTGARIRESLIPVSKSARSFREAITDGEDFELLFTAPPAEARRLLKGARSRIGVSVTPIGEITDRKHGYLLEREDGRIERLSPKGYLHF